MRDVRRDYAAYLRVVSSLPSDTQLVTQVSDELYQNDRDLIDGPSGFTGNHDQWNTRISIFAIARRRDQRAQGYCVRVSIPRMGMGRVWLRSIGVHRLQSMQEVSHAAPSKPLWSSVKHSLSKPIDGRDRY